MKKVPLTQSVFLSMIIVFCSCTKQPEPVDRLRTAGYIIGKEFCYTDATKDCYLIDLTFYPNTPQIGDTLLFNSIVYTNVIKSELPDSTARANLVPIVIEYNDILPKKYSEGCEIQNSISYSLKDQSVVATNKP